MKLYIDSIALSMLRGLKIDFVTDKREPNFIFKNINLNTGSGGGCGSNN